MTKKKKYAHVSLGCLLNVGDEGVLKGYSLDMDGKLLTISDLFEGLDSTFYLTFKGYDDLEAIDCRLFHRKKVAANLT